MIEGPIQTGLDSLSCHQMREKERLCGMRVVVSYGCEIGNGVGLRTTEKEIAALIFLETQQVQSSPLVLIPARMLKPSRFHVVLQLFPISDYLSCR